MDIKQWEDLDKIMRYLYENREGCAWYDVYTSLKMNPLYANSLLDIAKADEYIHIPHKGIRMDIPDSYFVRLTKPGLSFFARTNYVEEHGLRRAPQASHVIQHNTINNSEGVIISGDNSSNRIDSKENTKSSFLTNPWVVGIGAGLIVALLVYLLS